MVKHQLPLVVDAVIRMAARQCKAKRDCGAERKAPGSRNKYLRCDDCPFDDVDLVADLAFED